jgi:hypothetical protein
MHAEQRADRKGVEPGETRDIDGNAALLLRARQQMGKAPADQRRAQHHGDQRGRCAAAPQDDQERENEIKLLLDAQRPGMGEQPECR